MMITIAVVISFQLILPRRNSWIKNFVA